MSQEAHASKISRLITRIIVKLDAFTLSVIWSCLDNYMILI
jgi:hypothetical protein